MSSPETTPPIAASGLAASQLRRIRRIVDAAIGLAEQGGFEAVRLRDVAETSDVALGTLYKYFPSKEAILLYAVNEGNEGLERLMVDDPPRGETPPGRVADFFARATGTFTRRPDFARAVLRAIAGSDRATAIQQAGFHLRIGRMIIAALRGEKPDLSLPLSEPIGTAREQSIALMLNHVWFAALLGWSSGLHGSDVVADRMSQAIDLMLGGSK
ncbi:MAG: TetR/AcrR family transcriptional regulator [bacterium]|nr:TetR/AcrR family transcriptional regulator [bacterium]MCP5067146.1 TetR/AcrR family transcriptional regulator [bacterium]